MPTLSRTAPHDAQRPRQTLLLSKWQGRHNSSQLAGGEPIKNSGDGDEAQRWGAAICAARNAWSIQQRANGLVDRRLSKADAERALHRALAAIGDGGAHG